MSNPREVRPAWVDKEVSGFVMSSSAVIDLEPPLANPEGPSTTLYLEVEEDEDAVEFVWRFGTSEEVAGFGEAEIENGRSSDLEVAKSACWAVVIDS